MRFIEKVDIQQVLEREAAANAKLGANTVASRTAVMRTDLTFI